MIFKFLKTPRHNYIITEHLRDVIGLDRLTLISSNNKPYASSSDKFAEYLILKFDYNKNLFDFCITDSDEIFLYTEDLVYNNLTFDNFSTLYMQGSSITNPHLNELRDDIIIKIREYKLNKLVYYDL